MSLHHSDDQGESCRVEVAIIGAGPQALTLAASLLESQPYALDDAAELTAKRQRKGLHQKGDKSACKCGDIMVIDQEGEWLVGWRKAFDYFEIPTLRSPMLAHPDPRTELALLEACSLCEGGLRSALGDDQYYGMNKAIGGDEGNEERHGANLHQWNAKIMTKTKKGADHKEHHHHDPLLSRRGHRHLGPKRSFLEGLGFLYARPKSAVFMELCHDVIKRYGLNDRITKARAVSLTRTAGSSDILIGLSDGSAIRAGHVVCCMGPGRPRIPIWALPFRQSNPYLSPLIFRTVPDAMEDCEKNKKLAQDTIFHSSELPRLEMSAKELFHGHRVLIVGGGLTAAHLMLCAHRHDATSAVMVSRNNLRVSEFCTDLKWVGRCRHLLLADFRRQSIPERLKTIAKARPGGSITPCIKNKLRHLLEKNKETMTLMEGVEVKAIIPHEGKAWNLLFSDGQLHGTFDRIILATGNETDIRKDALLSPLLAGSPVNIDDEAEEEEEDDNGDGTDDDRKNNLSLSALQLPNLLASSCVSSCVENRHHRHHHQQGPQDALAYACGLPLPDPSLRLLPDHQIFVMGPYAALQLGPDAPNLNGGLMAARIISDEIRESRLRREKKNTGHVNGGEEEDDEEMVEDIHQLNNPFDLLRDDDDEEDEED